jgi:hypothetical protein
MLRIQTALRLAANFRARLGKKEELETEEGELSEEAESILDLLRQNYKLLTTGIARNRTLPLRQGFIGTELIHTYSELVLVDQFIALEREEALQFKQLGEALFDVPIYTKYLASQLGIGPAMAGVLVSKLDPHKAKHISSFWKFAGLDVAPDGRGRSRREEHLVERAYINKKGQEATRMGITYDPWLKSKLSVLATSFLRSKSPWVRFYTNYKHRIISDPARVKVPVEEWKRRNAKGENVDHLWPPGRINNAAKRYMVKMFLAELWTKWRELEGLPVAPTYQEAKLGHVHSIRKAAR